MSNTRKPTNKPVGVVFLAYMKRRKVQRRYDQEYHSQRAKHAANPKTQQAIIDMAKLAAEFDKASSATKEMSELLNQENTQDEGDQ